MENDPLRVIQLSLTLDETRALFNGASLGAAVFSMGPELMEALPIPEDVKRDAVGAYLRIGNDGYSMLCDRIAKLVTVGFPDVGVVRHHRHG